MHIGLGPTQSAAIKRLFCVNGNGHGTAKCPGCPEQGKYPETSDRFECKAFDRGVRQAAKRLIGRDKSTRDLLRDDQVVALHNAGWSSPVARQAHNLKAAGSNPAPATKSFFPYF